MSSSQNQHGKGTSPSPRTKHGTKTKDPNKRTTQQRRPTSHYKTEGA